ncbi:MAG: hypothetical protein AAF748_12540 [Pseudomonadota bacterium]
MSTAFETLAAGLGLAGFALYLGSYFALQMRLISGQGVAYPLLNLIAASCVLVDLQFSYHLPSTLIQISWISISLIGLWRAVVHARRN